MINTGIIRRIDDLGRIVIPKNIRNQLNIHEGDALEVGYDDGAVVLTRYRTEEEKTVQKQETKTKNVLDFEAFMANLYFYTDVQLDTLIAKIDSIKTERRSKRRETLWNKVQEAIVEYTINFGDIATEDDEHIMYFNQLHDFSEIGVIRRDC